VAELAPQILLKNNEVDPKKVDPNRKVDSNHEEVNKLLNFK
tara:strand:- start:216 stop:338 length:123 start_codon:yes stop_codon:yes gene_type:complete